GIGEAPAQLVGQLAVGEAHDPLERPGGALAGTHGEGEQLRDGGELGEHPRLAAVRLPGEQRVTEDDAAGEPEDEEDEEEDRRASLSRDEGEPEQAAEGGPTESVDDLLGAKVVGVRLPARPQEPSPDGARPAEDALDPAGEVADEGAEDGRDDRGEGHLLRLEEPGGLRGVPEVRGEPVVECRPAVAGQPLVDEHGAEGEHEPEERAAAPEADGVDEVGHRSTRPSSGSRPIRTMRRYATRVATAPAARTAAPAAVSYSCTDSGRVDRRASTIHGAATASRAALTVHDCRVSSSLRVRASSRRKDDSVRSSDPRSDPPTSRAIRRDSTGRAPAGSASRVLSRSRQSLRRPVVR